MVKNIIQIETLLSEEELTDRIAEKISKRFSKQFEDLKNGLPYPDRIVTRQKTADMLEVDLSTLWSWHKQKKLIPFGLAGRVYYRMSDIEKALVPLNEKKK